MGERDWKWQMSHACRDFEDLKRRAADKGYALPHSDSELSQVIASYRMGITPYYLNLIKTFDESDPVFRQIIPTPHELTIQAEELDDPIGDETPARGSRPLKALVHRYENRVLLFPTALCAVYCRFCFRKRLVGEPAHNAREEDLQAAYDYIAGHPEIHEVILTGGDPLTLGDAHLESILLNLDRIPHLRTLRIHSRLPVVNPYRLTPKLGRIISGLSTPVWVSTHFNHVQELTPDARDAVLSWVRQGIPFLNQSVLIKGVNDDIDSLKELLWGLIESRIKPYYLHQGDLVKGTSHLRVPIREGLMLIKQLRGALPGYAIPHYVWDQPGGHGKIPLENQIDLNHLNPGPSQDHK